MSSQEFRHIVRISGKDIQGVKKIASGISTVKGVGYNFANAILNSLNIDDNGNIGFLTDSEVESIENAIQNPQSIDLPPWFLNRRKDIGTGKDVHIIGSDIDINLRNDIARERNMRSWRGYRHTYGLKVRGQRTRTSGRGGGVVAVRKGGKVQPGQSSGGK